MSSLRNAVKRITHKERSQPRHRQHVGLLLEKKKDYKLRAQDYHKKTDKIKALKLQASMKNPDEFYFGMNRTQFNHNESKFVLQKKQSNDPSIITPDMIKLMKDQDLSYIRMQKQQDVHKMKRLQSSLHLMDTADSRKRRTNNNNDDDDYDNNNNTSTLQPKHTVFVDSIEQVKKFDTAQHFDTVPEFVNRVHHRPRKSTLMQQAKQKQVVVTKKDPVIAMKQQRKAVRTIAKARASAYREMEARRERITQMEMAEAHLVTEKLLAKKGKKRKIKQGQDGKPAQYKWSQKRLG